MSKWWKTRQPTREWSNRYGDHFELAKGFLDSSRIKWERRQNQEWWIWNSLVGAAIILIVLAGVLWANSIRIGYLKQNNQKLQDQNDQIVAQDQEIKEANEAIGKLNKQLISSIGTATEETNKAPRALADARGRRWARSLCWYRREARSRASCWRPRRSTRWKTASGSNGVRPPPYCRTWRCRRC